MSDRYGIFLTNSLVILSPLNLHETEEERLAKLNKLFGAWKNQPDLT
jgi:antitoxin ParD1/3/4